MAAAAKGRGAAETQRRALKKEERPLGRKEA